MKKPYPFHPTEDSLIGNVIHNTFQEEGSVQNFQEAISSYIQEGDSYFFTSRSQKQTILDLYPPKLRKWISEGNIQEVKNFFLDLLNGKLTDTPAMDVALELFEWILVGFQDEQIAVEILQILTASKIPCEAKHIQKILSNYLKILERENYLKEPK